MKILKNRFFKAVAVYLVISILAEAVCPTVAYALTSGPTQPEYVGFEPIATTNMVDPFTGQFTYNLPVVNVPGPNGGGYALSLSYHSGSSAEEEASWVGYGWSLNPGVINRNKRGFPDDANGTSVTYYNQMPDVFTIKSGPKIAGEIFSIDLPASVSSGITYNNNKGFGTFLTGSISDPTGITSLSYTVSEEGHSFSFDINPGALMQKNRNQTKNLKRQINSLQKNENGDMKKLGGSMKKYLKEQRRKQAGRGGIGALASVVSQYGMHALMDECRPTTVSGYDGVSTNVVVDFMPTVSPAHIGPKFGLMGSVTYQVPVPKDSKNAFGFMYSGNAISSDENLRVMDYYVEKESNFNKRDKFLPIPFQSTDIFGITGEGIGGGFRLHNKRAGHFYPAFKTSTTRLLNASYETSAGLNFEPAGFTVGGGEQNLFLRNWASSEMGNTDLYQFATNGSDDEAYFFRFNHDLGGSVSYSSDDAAYSANVVNVSNFPGTKQFKPWINSDDINNIMKEANGTRNGRSSYIGYHTNAEMTLSKATNRLDNSVVNYKSFNKSSSSRNFVNRNSVIQDQIGEISTVNEEGNRYVYGLPVFTAEETSMSYGLKESGQNLPTVYNNHIVYKDASVDKITQMRMASGEVSPNPYAINYLLTEITTSDYIDRTFDGPTYDDFGGWTKFNYNRAYGTDSKGDHSASSWYAYRFPYNGLYYKKNEFSDNRDDVGSVNSGVKEIYYLNSIETKTHIAYFVTNATDITVNGIHLLGSGAGTRTDGLGADLVNASLSPSAKNVNQPLQQLEKIILFAKDPNSGNPVGKALKVVHLEYFQNGTEYTSSDVLAKDLPNSSYTFSNGKKGGKLTLKRVWFEYEGTVNSKITPYEFKYQYKNDYLTGSELTTPNQKYTDITSYGTSFTPVQQNPDYNPYDMDNWGNYAYNGAARRANFMPWVYQGLPDPAFDPAAWQLKSIKLPSGGEILIQYEQNDYCFVQDQPALSMVSLLPTVIQDQSTAYVDYKSPASDVDPNKYYLNLNDINVSPSEITNLYNTIVDYLSKHDNRLYFKFLYTLNGSATPTPNNCDVDYIEGYAKVTANYDANGVYVIFDPGYSFPRALCIDHVKRNKSGMDIRESCDEEVMPFESGGSTVGQVRTLFKYMGKAFNPEANSCLKMSPQYSYIRIPLSKDKKGGGIRVKRILMYDKGIETGDESLYGSEYIYKTVDGKSSGVASNEPAEANEENALINYLDKRSKQSLASKIIGGIDRENFEGPLGESILPPPSIGYSRVVVKNIHTGKTTPGFTVHEFYTYKDENFAYSKNFNYTPMDEHAQDYVPVPAILVNLLVDNRWVSQGYSFVINEMHGKVKRVATFGGDYVVGTTEDAYTKSFEQIYEYFKPGEGIPVMNEDGTITTGYPGKEEEVAMEMKAVDDILTDASIQVDFSVGIAFVIPIPEPSLCPYFTHEEKRLRTHVTSRVIRYPAIQKSVTVYQDGIYHKTENKAFSSTTGDPVVVVNADGYDNPTATSSNGKVHMGTYSAYDIPAHFVYNQMGQKSKNERYYISNINAPLTSNGGKYSFTLSNLTSLVTAGRLVEGDLVLLNGSSNQNLFYIDNFNGNTITLQSLSYITTDVTTVNDMEVINSGYTNQLHASIAKITTYGTDYVSSGHQLPPTVFKVSSGQKQLETANLNNNTISASISTYSDKWASSILDADYGLTTNTNDFETARRGKWRLKSMYGFKTDITDGVDGTNKNYDAGKFSLSNYNFTDTTVNDYSKWLQLSLVDMYTPNGNAIQERNSINIPSAARFGYNENVPVMVAQNAAYTSVFFSSFEDVTTGVSGVAHSGSNSYLLGSNQVLGLSQGLNPGYVIMNSQLRNNGLLMKYWIKTPDNYPDITTSINSYILPVGGSNPLTPFSTKIISRVGEWTLVESKWSLTYVDGTKLLINLQNYSYPVWIDDVRVQPIDAQSTCYVYDSKNLRLLTTFDDQHFGLYYQYNAEGKLVRKLVETERGMKTISETQYNTSITNQ
jgi:hypothetical protein